MITDGPNEPRDTYIQPRLSIDLYRWVNAPFAMYMDGWFLDEVDCQTTTPVSSQKPSSDTSILNLLAHTTDPVMEDCTSLTVTTNQLISSIKHCISWCNSHSIHRTKWSLSLEIPAARSEDSYSTSRIHIHPIITIASPHPASQHTLSLYRSSSDYQ